MLRFLNLSMQWELPTAIDRVIGRHMTVFNILLFPVLIGAALFAFVGFIGTDPKQLYSFWSQISENPWFLVYFFLLALALVVRLVITILGYFWHKKTFGHAVSPRYIIFMHSSFWMFQIVFAVAAIGFAFLVASAAKLVASWYGHEINWSDDYVQSGIETFVESVPTLISLPYFVSFMLVYLATSFFSYWQHRLPHESRLLWLLAHRPHHTSTTLTDVTVMEADPAFALGFFNRLIFAILAGLSAKLIHSDPMIYEFLALALLTNLMEVFNHSSVFYERMTKLWQRYPLAKWLFMLPGCGPYHYLHHSSKVGDEVINIGGGPFLLWDRVFGTFKEPPLQKPAIGLTNQPEIYINPIAHVFSGIAQIAYELRHNQTWKIRAKILFGSAYYTPPISRDYLKKPASEQSQEPSLPHMLVDHI